MFLICDIVLHKKNDLTCLQQLDSVVNIDVVPHYYKSSTFFKKQSWLYVVFCKVRSLL